MKVVKWVEEIPRTVRAKRGSEYDTLIEELKKNPGKVALVGSYPIGTPVKGVMPLRDRGAKVSRRTYDGKVHVYAEWPKKAPAKKAATKS